MSLICWVAIDTKTAFIGEYVQLGNSNFTIPDGATDMVIAVETADETMNFYIDEAIGAPAGTLLTGPGVKGDVNADGAFNVADVILLQRWLLAVPDTHLADWKAADFCEDDKLDVFDLCLMKRRLINSQ